MARLIFYRLLAAMYLFGAGLFVLFSFLAVLIAARPDIQSASKLIVLGISVVYFLSAIVCGVCFLEASQKVREIGEKIEQN